MLHVTSGTVSRLKVEVCDAAILESLRDIGQDPARVLALANSADANAALAAETNAARDLGIFGSPTFTVGRELFWATTGWKMRSVGAWLRLARHVTCRDGAIRSAEKRTWRRHPKSVAHDLDYHLAQTATPRT